VKTFPILKTNRIYPHMKVIVIGQIIKAHGGEIKVETKEGEGSEFIVVLPA
jgi:signal transduction histidine kinase